MKKMEGTNFSITKKNEEGVVKIYVNQRNNTIEELPNVENTFWKITRESGLLKILEEMTESNITVYAELCGPKIQNNIYNLKNHKLFVFDVKLNSKFVDYPVFKNICDGFPQNDKLETAPLLFKGLLKDFLNGESVQKMSNGHSMVLRTMLREGIVIKTCKEVFIQGYGRGIIKQRSPEYLSKTDN